MVVSSPQEKWFKMSEKFIDVGLRLPNGKEVWSEYKGFSLATPESRFKLAEALAQTEADLNIPQGDFLHQHIWVKREFKSLGDFAINDPALITDDADKETDGQ
jgi:hypothetical protein